MVDKKPADPGPTLKPKSRSSPKEGEWNPDAVGDITKLTGAEEGADPTLTHDLLSRSREGQWGKFPASVISDELIQ